MQESLPTTPGPDDAVRWYQGKLYLLDQRRLPAVAEFLVYDTVVAAAEAIRDMVVRGAPAIGVAAAYAVVLAAREAYAEAGTNWQQAIEPRLEMLAAARPTAINLRWAVERMQACIATLDGQNPETTLLELAQQIHAEDIAANQHIGALGANLIAKPTAVITHCNAGALATGGYGTALGVIRSAWQANLITRVYADETRPWLQGARLTAWELMQDGIPVTLQADVAAASLMATGNIGWVIVGADRVTANGDFANKIGTYGLAIMAKYHGVKFMVAAPVSTIDITLPNGSAIPIEERDASEILACGGQATAPAGCAVRNPVFDVTPASLVDALVTERGIVLNPDAEKIATLMQANA